MKWQSFYNLISHFCHILLVRSKLLNVTHTQGGGSHKPQISHPLGYPSSLLFSDSTFLFCSFNIDSSFLCSFNSFFFPTPLLSDSLLFFFPQPYFACSLMHIPYAHDFQPVSYLLFVWSSDLSLEPPLNSLPARYLRMSIVNLAKKQIHHLCIFKVVFLSQHPLFQTIAHFKSHRLETPETSRYTSFLVILSIHAAVIYDLFQFLTISWSSASFPSLTATY